MQMHKVPFGVAGRDAKFTPCASHPDAKATLVRFRHKSIESTVSRQTQSDTGSNAESEYWTGVGWAEKSNAAVEQGNRSKRAVCIGWTTGISR